MGLYLCIFDGDVEIDGVEVGSYADFNFFRDTVAASVENGERGSRCPILLNHHDSDGEWSPREAEQLIDEFDLIKTVLMTKASVEFNSLWKKKVALACGLKPKNLLDCFFDIDGEPLLDRLRRLAEKSVQKKSSILFQ